ncbi:hypothetical protein AB0A63_17125 [Lentzea sp. NPDC042327]|uniref:hypothetical protein n=1 Tax=Lentzea sp. NPDC042327 TaxID=3154801 RepID=UPI0033E6977C
MSDVVAGRNAAGEVRSRGSHGIPAQLRPPAPPKHFVGRAGELEQLRPNGVTVISGPAGVGKTALALKWLRDRGSGDQLHVDLTVREPVEVRLGRLLRALRLTHVDRADRAAAFRSIVLRQRITLLLDNASSAEQVRPFLPARGTVLVTSRAPLDLDAPVVELDPLTDEDGSLPPLLDLSYVELPERQARLYRLCAWHPGAHFDVPEAAAIAGESECDVEDALDDLVEKALLTEVGDDAFRFHDLVRAHARAKRHAS